MRVCAFCSGLFYRILSGRLQFLITLCLAITAPLPKYESKMMAETLQVRFPFLADDMLGPVTDYDVAMAYEFFLGRPPENSTAINSHKQRRFDDMIKAFIGSDEFLAATYQNLMTGRLASRPDNTRAPSRQQMSWITKKLVLTEEQRNDLYSAESWEKFFNKLLGNSSIKTEQLLSQSDINLVEKLNHEPSKVNYNNIMASIQNIEVLLNEIKTMIQNK